MIAGYGSYGNSTAIRESYTLSSAAAVTVTRLSVALSMRLPLPIVSDLNTPSGPRKSGSCYPCLHASMFKNTIRSHVRNYQTFWILLALLSRITCTWSRIMAHLGWIRLKTCFVADKNGVKH